MRILPIFIGCLLFLPSITAQESCETAIGADCGLSYAGSTLGVVSDNDASGATAASCSGMLNSTGQNWYSFVAPESSQLSISTCGSSFDTFLSVYEGSCGALSCVASNDDAGSACNNLPNGSGLHSYLTFAAEAGVTYLIRVGGFGNSSGDYALNIDCATQEGCTNSSACNYEPLATSDDGSCEFESCLGCTDYSANNYDASATIDDGSCTYCSDNGNVSASLYICTFGNGQNVELSLFDQEGNLLIEVPTLGNGAIMYFELCLDPTQCYTAVMGNNTGPFGWYGGYFWINAGGAQIINQSLDASLASETASFSIAADCNDIVGCMDETACNYSPEASIDSGDCSYAEDCNDLIGCTNPLADNYNPIALTDDGSCTFGAGATCAEAIAAECGMTYSGSTAGIPNDNATSGVAGTSCGTNIYSAGQHWYSLEVQSLASITINTCGSLFDTYLRVYSGSCGDLTCVTFNDDSGINCNGIPNGNSFDSYATFIAEPGITYLIRVSGFGSGSGEYTLSVECGTQSGCTDALACNFDAQATEDDGSCEYESCLGCTDFTANNYDPSATTDDGSCTYCSDNGGVAASLYVCTFSNGSQVELSIFDQDGNLVFEVPTLGNGQIMYFDLCLDPSQCYTAVMGNNTGPFGWYNGYFWINADGVQIINQSLDSNLSTETVIFTISGDCGQTVGCTDELACNYDPAADIDSGNCVYAEDCNDLVGCTNPSATNYNPTATTDDGSCEFGAGSTCGEAIAAECGGSYSGSTVGVPNDSSTSGASEANCGGAANTGGQHWYSLTATTSGPMSVSTCGSAFDTYLRVYSGECGALTCVASNDDGGNACTDANGDFLDSFVTFEAVEGTTYLIRVGGFSSISGSYELHVDCASNEVAGCTDPAAINFNDAATTDDGSCVYEEEEGGSNSGYAVDFETVALEFKVFPVPAVGDINLQVNRLTQPGRLRVAVYSADGRLIRSESYTHSESYMRVTMNVSDLAAGYYFVESTGYWGKQVIPFVKE